MLECEAVCLTTLAYGEADRIATFLGRGVGQVRGLARGARRSRRRFGAALDPGARGLLAYRPRAAGGLGHLESVSRVQPFRAGGDPVAGFAVASVLLEGAAALTVEGHESDDVFTELVAALDHIAAHGGDRGLAAERLAALLAAAGFAVSLSECARCGATLGATSPGRFDRAAGGMLCRGCDRAPAADGASTFALAEVVGAVESVTGRALRSIGPLDALSPVPGIRAT